MDGEGIEYISIMNWNTSCYDKKSVDCEDIWVDVILLNAPSTSKFVVRVVYRRPNPNIDGFSIAFNEVLLSLNNSRLPYLVLLTMI